MKPNPVRIALVLCAAVACSHAQRTPHIGYIFPAGGQQGSSFEAMLGGQYLGGVEKAYVSGNGVSIEVLHHIKTLPQFKLNELRQKINEVQKQVAARKNNKSGKKFPPIDYAPFAEFSEHFGMPIDSVQTVMKLRGNLYNPKKQLNPQLGESVRVKVTIAPNALPGRREVRLHAGQGVTHPIFFQVNALPEYTEVEPNNKDGDTGIGDALPVIINGQVLPGDIDRFTFTAKKGQKLVAAASARELVPYLADAVPGWFQAVITLYDDTMREVAYVDDFRFKPDPALYFEVPQSGEYVLEIRDSIYRGREDFVYRIILGEVPYITGAFPLGGQAGTETTIGLTGWNLPKAKHTFVPKAAPGSAQQWVSFPARVMASPPLPFAVDTAAGIAEREPNNDRETAQRLNGTTIIDGRIDQPGDVDVFRIQGRAGEQVVAEILARRLDSPVDSMLKLMDSTGKLLAFNDDYVDKGAGLATHHADSRLIATLPADGTYFVRLNDTQQQGGAASSYRLRIGAPAPDFALRVAPCTINIQAGNTLPITVFALRKDGFEGDIELSLKNPPEGFSISGAWLPAGQEKIQLTLTVPDAGQSEPFALQLRGQADIDGKSITRTAIPAEDRMQAFLYRHLVAAEDWLVTVRGKRKYPHTMQVLTEGTLQVDRTAKVQIKAPKWQIEQGLDFELKEPPTGFTLKTLARETDTVTLLICADEEKVKPGLKGNFILSAFMDREQKGKGGKVTIRRSEMGTLPALRFEVVRKKLARQ